MIQLLRCIRLIFMNVARHQVDKVIIRIGPGWPLDREERFCGSAEVDTGTLRKKVVKPC